MYCNKNWLWLMWAFRGPKAADKKINNCTHCPVWAFRGQKAAVNKINNGTHPENQKKNVSHHPPVQQMQYVNHCTLATPPQPQWHYSHQRQTTHPIMLYKRLLNPGMHYQMCQHSQTALNIKPVSQRRPRGGSDTRVTTAPPTTAGGLEPKHA